LKWHCNICNCEVTGNGKSADKQSYKHQQITRLRNNAQNILAPTPSQSTPTSLQYAAPPTMQSMTGLGNGIKSPELPSSNPSSEPTSSIPSSPDTFLQYPPFNSDPNLLGGQHLETGVPNNAFISAIHHTGMNGSATEFNGSAFSDGAGFFSGSGISETHYSTSQSSVENPSEEFWFNLNKMIAQINQIQIQAKYFEPHFQQMYTQYPPDNNMDVFQMSLKESIIRAGASAPAGRKLTKVKGAPLQKEISIKAEKVEPEKGKEKEKEKEKEKGKDRGCFSSFFFCFSR